MTFRNTSTGTFSGATWTVIKVNLLTRVSVVVATSHASGGFTAELPAPNGPELYMAALRLSTPLPMRFGESCAAGF